MKVPLIVFTLLALALSACGTTPTPELGTGVDEYGPYTVVARSGDDTLSTQGSTNYAQTRYVELRKYSGVAQYGSFLNIVSKSGSMSYKGDVILANYSLGGSRLNSYSKYFDRTIYEPVGLSLGGPGIKTMKGPRVCAIADGEFRNKSTERYERTDSYLKVCVKTYGK